MDNKITHLNNAEEFVKLHDEIKPFLKRSDLTRIAEQMETDQPHVSQIISRARNGRLSLNAFKELELVYLHLINIAGPRMKDHAEKKARLLKSISSIAS